MGSIHSVVSNKGILVFKNVLGFSIDYYNTVSGNELLDSESKAVFDSTSTNISVLQIFRYISGLSQTQPLKLSLILSGLSLPLCSLPR